MLLTPRGHGQAALGIGWRGGDHGTRATSPGARTPQLAQGQAARKLPELSAPIHPQVTGDHHRVLSKQSPDPRPSLSPWLFTVPLLLMFPSPSIKPRLCSPLFFQHRTSCTPSCLLFPYHTPASLPAPIHAANLPHPLSTALSIHTTTAALETVWFPWQPLSISGVGGDAAGRMLLPPCKPGAGTQGSVSPVEWVWRAWAAPYWEGCSQSGPIWLGIMRIQNGDE